jgi:methylenetetrahydrofolate reductase (NADPH)
MGAPSLLQATLDAGQFLLSAELTPPRGSDLSVMLKHAAALKNHVHVVQLNDQLLAHARCSTLVAAAMVKDLGLEPVLQFSLRHRNRIAIQSDLLGIAALGLRNVIVLSGYPIKIGSDPQAVDATDLPLIESIRAIAGLSHPGVFFNGDKLPAPLPLHVGTIEIPCMTPEEIPASLDKLSAKIEAGARYIQVQAIFDLEPMRAWMSAITERGLHKKAHFIAAVFPFSGSERLRFLQKVPGLCIPEHVIARVASQDGDKESLAITLELIEGIRAMPGIAGLHLRCIGAEDWVPRILSGARLDKPSRAA